MTLNIEHCYDYQALFATALEKACCGKKAYIVTVVNNGLSQETFLLKLKTPIFATLSEEEVTLAPGESRDVTVYVDVPCLDDQFEIRLIAESTLTGLKVEDVLTLHSLTTSSCRKVKVLNDNVFVNDQTKSFDLLVQNQGIEDGTYAFYYNGTFLSPSASGVDIKAGQVKNITLYTTNISMYNTGIYLDDITFTNQESGVNYDETVRVNLRERSIITKFFSYVFSDVKCMLFFFFLIAALIFALLVLFVKEVLVYFSEGRVLYYRRIPYSRPALQRLIIWFVLGFAILFVMAFALSNTKSYAPVHKSLYYEMYSNDALTIDMNQYFEDPDNDSLIYTASLVDNIAVDVNQNVATLRPNENFYGERIVVFTADDGKGGKTDSAVVTVTVLKREQITLSRLFTRYCSVFFVSLICLIWIIVFAIHVKRGRVVWYYRKRKGLKP